MTPFSKVDSVFRYFPFVSVSQANAFLSPLVDWYCGSYINPLTLTNMKNNLSGNSTFAGALAAVMANVVLIAYVIVAMREDQGERQQKGTLSRETEAKKDR